MRKPKQNYPVDETVQRRLDSLEWLIDREYDQSVKMFQDRTGITMTQVNQWFSGYRALRDKALKRLEEKTRKKAGWFDVVRAAANIKAPMLQASGVVDPINSIEYLLEDLSRHFTPLDSITRRIVGSVLPNLAESPESYSQVTGSIVSAINSAKQKRA